jgi:hypothetical protein
MTPKELIENYERTLKEFREARIYDKAKSEENKKWAKLLIADIQRNGAIIFVDMLYFADNDRLLTQSLKTARIFV